jgi:hypothetical protein
MLEKITTAREPRRPRDGYPVFIRLSVAMAKSESVNRKKKSRRLPGADALVIALRVPRAELAPIDAWIRAQAAPRPTRAEAIRRLAHMALARLRPAGRRSNKSAARASDMAGQALDRLGEDAATAEVRAQRKRRLLKGPAEFRAMRDDLPTRPKD